MEDAGLGSEALALNPVRLISKASLHSMISSKNSQIRCGPCERSWSVEVENYKFQHSRNNMFKVTLASMGVSTSKIHRVNKEVCLKYERRRLKFRCPCPKPC